MLTDIALELLILTVLVICRFLVGRDVEKLRKGLLQLVDVLNGNKEADLANIQKLTDVLEKNGLKVREG